MVRSRLVTTFFSLLIGLALHLFSGVVPTAHAQGSRKDDIVFNTRGLPLAGATVRVCAMPATGQPCSPLANIYSDPGLTQALANPTTTDGLGNYYFYAAPGRYEIEVSGPTITTKQIPNVILPSDPSAPTFSSINSTGGISAFSLSLTGNLTVNGSTSVIGNLASGTMTLSNQGTPPGTPGAGTVNLYTKTADKRLYYKDETGTEIGPIASASGAQTNQVNTFTAVQNFAADVHTKGPNPYLDVTLFGGYSGPNYNGAATTGGMTSGSATLSLAAASDFQNNHGVLVLGAGPAPIIATPTAPTVTPIAQTGTSQYSYCVADRDWYGGITPCSPAGSTSTGFSAFGLQSYTISGWSRSGGVVTVTTSTPHNIPTTPYNSSSPYPQAEIPLFSTSNRQCEGAYSLTAVPSATTVQFTQYGVPDSTSCVGGTLRVLPKVVLAWSAPFTYSVTSATCSGTTATLGISPALDNAGVVWVVPWFVKAAIAGVGNAAYNGTFVISNYGTGLTTVNYTVPSCSGVPTLGAGGTLQAVPGKAAKNHLIYRCAGSSCALPANAANYALVGVAVGNDAYFVDNGWGVTASNVDTGDAPTTAPTSATNDYLDTTILSGGGTTTLTLAKSASSTVSGTKVFHDNAPNLLLACAALSANTSGSNGGHIRIPAASSIFNWFPIAGNFDMAGIIGSGAAGQPPSNCPTNTTIEVANTLYQDGGTIILGRSSNLVADQGSTNCVAPFYQLGEGMACSISTAYPSVYFEPEQTNNNVLQNIYFNGNGNYQVGMLFDQQLNGDGSVSQRFRNVHVAGGPYSYPMIDKAGFGRFWEYGGWSAGQHDFSTSRDYLFTTNCGNVGYQATPSAPLTYIVDTRMTYSFGTINVDTCGKSNGHFGYNVVFHQMLTESPAGPAFLVNNAPYGVTAITFDQGTYSDLTGGFATPYFDFTNSTVNSAEFVEMGCATSTQPLMETGTNAANYAGIYVKAAQGGCGGGVGAINYRFDNLTQNLALVNGFNTQLGAGSQIYSPMPQPGNFQSASAVTGPGLPVGTYQPCVIAVDPFGGVTQLSTAACTTVNITTTGTQSIQLQMPSTQPPGSTGFIVFDNAYGNYMVYNSCLAPYATAGQTITLTATIEGCAFPQPTKTTAVQSYLSTSNGIGGPKIQVNGEFVSSGPRAEQNVFLPGALTSTWTGATWTTDHAITVTRVQVQAKTAPSGCSTNAVVRFTDGTTPINVTISGAANDSGSIAQNYAAGATLTLSVQTAAAGCTTSPADANVTVQYRMQ